MYPLGKNNYPTLVQKHFNGAVPCLSSGIDTKNIRKVLITLLCHVVAANI